jgi:hypothetical protein
MPLPRRWSALGLSQPLGGFGRDDAREPELPRTHAYAVATPRNVAALFHAAGAHGIRPSELSPLGEPCRLPTALCFLAGSSSTVTRRESPGDLRPFSPARPSAADTDDPLRERCRPLEGETRAPHGRHVRSPRRNARVAPHAPLRRPPEPSGTTGTRPARPLRSLAPPESPFTDRPRLSPRLARQSLRPHALRPTGPMLSWDYAPSEPSPPRPRVRSTASGARGEPDAPRKTTPHSGRGERRFDPEV